MLRVNLWDNSFIHLANDEGAFSSVHGKIPKHIRYDSKLTNYDGITIFTDVYCNRNTISSISSKTKIGWLLENRSLFPQPYNEISSYIDMLDFIFTDDETLLRTYPDKARFVPVGGSWVKRENFGLRKKSKLVSIIYSHKKTPFEGYAIRHDIAGKYPNKLDHFGNGSSNPIEFKEEALEDYMFSIIIENVSDSNYFTEKLIDSMVSYTIPIYWGCPNIGDFFDTSGIIDLNVNNFDNILNSLNTSLYISMLRSAGVNYNKAIEYEITEDWMYHNILKDIMN